MVYTKNVRRRVYALIMKGVTYLAVAALSATTLFIIGYVLARGLGGVTWTFLTTKPSYLTGNIGILPDILNTLYLIISALALVLPLGVGAAIYLTEYASNKKLVALVEFAAETLSGIPSILYGLVGMLVFCQLLGIQTSLLAGALTLVIMNLPIIIRNTQESLKAVKPGYREGAFALGAGKWRTVYTVVLPSAVDGIISGCILSVGRILGESAALLFTAGFAHALNGFFEGMQSAGASLTVALYVYAKEQGEFGAAFAIAAILLCLSFILNIIASLAGRRLKRRIS